jgi:hypothetical protein
MELSEKCNATILNLLTKELFAAKYKLSWFQQDTQKQSSKVKKKVKLSRYTPWRQMGGEEV